MDSELASLFLLVTLLAAQPLEDGDMMLADIQTVYLISMDECDSGYGVWIDSLAQFLHPVSLMRGFSPWRPYPLIASFVVMPCIINEV